MIENKMLCLFVPCFPAVRQSYCCPFGGPLGFRLPKRGPKLTQRGPKITQRSPKIKSWSTSSKCVTWETWELDAESDFFLKLCFFKNTCGEA